METDWQRLIDELGPEKVVLLSDPGAGLRAVLVVDNTAAGPAIGGVRMAADVTIEEVFRLARAMTFKNAAASLPHGGGKAGIVGDPLMPADEKERLVRAFACSIRDIVDYIPGPDMGMTETAMAIVIDEIGRAVGLPEVMGGIPLDKLGATGFGLAIAAEVVEEFGYVKLDGARVVIQGFGAVGSHVARFLTERGAVIVGVSDSRGGVVNQAGLDVDKMSLWKEAGHSVSEFGGGTEANQQQLVHYPCDIWIPAARPDTFTGANAALVEARVVLPGANIAVTEPADEIFFERGILSLPDFIVNAGGVMCAAVEYRGGTASQAFHVIEEKIRANTCEVLETAHGQNVMPAAAARQLARSRVEEAMSYRRRH